MDAGSVVQSIQSFDPPPQIVEVTEEVGGVPYLGVPADLSAIHMGTTERLHRM